MKRIALSAILFIISITALCQEQYILQRVHDSINTTGSETGAVIIDDSLLLYTTMSREETPKLYLMDFSPILTQVNIAPISPDGTLGKGDKCRWGINANGQNCGNVAYDAQHQVIYYTRSEAHDNSPKRIYYSRRLSGNRWSKGQLVGGDVNIKGYSSTHPAIGMLPNGETVLFFSSDRPGGLGGMDLWYAILISPGLPGNSINLGAPVNTDSNEVTPFYASHQRTLYFSSNRADAIGGYDIYQSEGARNSWQPPVNMGPSLNSKFDDVFFNLQPCTCRCATDTLNPQPVESCGFLSSNRPGSLYRTDSNCCHDLFRWQLLASVADTTPLTDTLIPHASSVADLLPLSLYFHNDEPNPRTLDTTTQSDYTSTYRRYLKHFQEYKGAQPSPVDPRQWDSIQNEVDYFFRHELPQGHSNMLQLFEFLQRDLQAGRNVTLTIGGYASPLFESLYNVNLSLRRIQCFKNQLMQWNNAALLPYLTNGMLQIKSQANGAPSINEVEANSPLRNPKSEKSVYSMAAAHARRIQIIGYDITK